MQCPRGYLNVDPLRKGFDPPCLSMSFVVSMPIVTCGMHCNWKHFRAFLPLEEPMTTFTFRAPNQLAARLSSAEMRSWLDDFVRQPHALPIDPGSGGGRISLMLPESTVKSVTAYCQCGISSALRRIAFDQLEGRMASPGYDGSPAILHDTGSAANPIPVLLMNAVLWILVVGVWIFVRSRKDRIPIRIRESTPLS